MINASVFDSLIKNAPKDQILFDFECLSDAEQFIKEYNVKYGVKLVEQRIIYVSHLGKLFSQIMDDGEYYWYSDRIDKLLNTQAFVKYFISHNIKQKYIVRF